MSIKTTSRSETCSDFGQQIPIQALLLLRPYDSERLNTTNDNNQLSVRKVIVEVIGIHWQKLQKKMNYYF